MKRKPIIIAVTGSAGKTTTKEMIASILRRKWPVYKSPANRNLMVHTRAHARRIRPTHKAAVLEYRIPRRGNLRQHCRIFQPSIGIITNIGTAHLGHFGGSQRRLAMAKSELIRHMKPHGIIFLNADCPYTRQFGKQPYRGRFRGRIITVGIKRRAMYAARNIRHTPSGLTFTCVLNGVNVSFSIPIPGTHNIINALLAIAVCHQLGLAAQDIQSGLLNYPRPKRRLTVTRHRHQITIIDDTYSANPSAVMAALNVLRQIGEGKKIAVLGSMLELGKYTRKGHALVGRYASRKRLHALYLLGPSTRFTYRAAIRSGLSKKRVRYCKSLLQLHRLLAKNLTPHSTILLKGSHRLHMNRTSRFLRRLANRMPDVLAPNPCQSIMPKALHLLWKMCMRLPVLRRKRRITPRR